MPENITGSDDQETSEDDQTSKKKEEDFLNEFPDEEEGLEEKEKAKAKDEKESAAVAQKIKYREKLLKAQEKVRELTARLEEKQKTKQSTEVEEKELAAQRYIRDLARKEYESARAEEKAKEEAALEAFQEKVDMAVESSGYTEDQILEISEEFEVEPDIAVKILKRSEKKTSAKPKLPSPKGADETVETKEKVSTAGKSIFDLAQEAKKTLRGMLRR